MFLFTKVVLALRVRVLNTLYLADRLMMAVLIKMLVFVDRFPIDSNEKCCLVQVKLRCSKGYGSIYVGGLQ